MSGPEGGDQLLARRPDIKMLFMSGYTPRALDDRGLANTDAAFLEKPFTSPGLARAVRTLLDSPGHRATSLNDPGFRDGRSLRETRD